MPNNIAELLKNVQSEMEKKSINMLSESDTSSMINDASDYDYFLGALSEGLEEKDSKEFINLAKQSKMEFLKESNSASSLSTFNVLNTALLRSIWPRLAVRQTATVKTMTTPSEVFAYYKHYFLGADGVTRDLPEMFKAGMTKGKKFSIDITLPTENFDILNASGTPRTGYTTLDRRPRFTEFTATVTNPTTSATEVITLKQVVSNNELYTYEQSLVFIDSSNNPHNTKFLAKLDREKGIVEYISATNNILKEVRIEGYISSESNLYTGEIHSKYEKDTIEVGDGDIIHSSLPFQFIKDSQALFDIDGYAEAVSMLGIIFSRQIDLEILQDYYDILDDKAYPNQSLEVDVSTFYGKSHIGIPQHSKDAAILARVLRGIACIENRIPFNGEVEYSLIMNPIEASIFQTSNPTLFKGNLRGGSMANYVSAELATTATGAPINIHSTPLAEQGRIIIVPKSNLRDEIVYGYYEYSQALLPSGYRNPKNPNVPSVSMAKRDAKKVFRKEAFQEIIVKDALSQ
jgi:hypothetical protein